MPSGDMFFDDAHMNTKKGIPFIVKFLKRVLNIPNTQTRRPSLSDSSMPKSKLEPPPNYRYPKNGPLDVNNNRSPHPPLDDISNNQFRPLMPPIPPFIGQPMPFLPWMWGSFNPYNNQRGFGDYCWLQLSWLHSNLSDLDFHNFLSRSLYFFL